MILNQTEDKEILK